MRELHIVLIFVLSMIIPNLIYVCIVKSNDKNKRKY